MANQAASEAAADGASGFVRELGLLDSTMIVAGSMIGSGIFIVSADIARTVGSPGNLLMVWIVTGLLTITAALSYGELAAMMPQAGGQYVYLREAYSPLWGFLYGWTLFLVIQTGTIAAVAVGFSRYLGVLVPGIGATEWVLPPLDISSGYAISISRQQLVGIVMVIFITWLNTRGIHLGKMIQNTFTVTKTASLLLLIVVGIIFGRNAEAMASNFSGFWTLRDVVPLKPDLSFVSATIASAGAFGIFVAYCVSQVGSLFSSDAWNNITFTAGEVKNPKRNIPLSLAAGTMLVITLYILANVAYMCTLTFQQIQNAPDDRVATAALGHMFGPVGATIMAIAIVISTFGCNNGLILSGARVYYAMAKDGLFFRRTGTLNAHRVPAAGLILQGLWACVLILMRTRKVDAAGAVSYGNLYGALLDYVVFAVLIFYVLTIAGIFRLRRTQPNVERPYKAFGYPLVPALYILAASAILLVLLFYRTSTSWPGLVIVLTGIPVYLLWRRKAA
ncbi:MAG: amino acid permease [Acidobacteriota bacterium]